jgi:hypothetical protein
LGSFLNCPFFTPELLNKKTMNRILGEAFFQDVFHGLQRNLYPRGAAMTAGGTNAPEGADRYGAAVMTVAVPAENYDQAVFHQSGDDYMEDVDYLYIEIGNLHTGIRAFHRPEKTDHAITVTALVFVGIIEVLEKTARYLV